MPQSLSNCLVHAIWSTKDRYPFLTDKALRDEFHAVIGGISAKLGCPTLIVGGVADHVHILMRLARTISIADWVMETKRASTMWMKSYSEKASRSPHRAAKAEHRLSAGLVAEPREVGRAERAVARGAHYDPMLAKFKWQAGYADFSVSESNTTTVRRYIANQERHHKEMTLHDEYRKFLSANHLAWDERFAWD